MISITCNVAWGAEFLPAMLSILEEHGAKATFFMEGRWVEQFPELTRHIYAQGHELGNHSYSHPYPTQISPEELRSEILETEALLENLTGLNHPCLPHLTGIGIGRWWKLPPSWIIELLCGALIPLIGNSRGGNHYCRVLKDPTMGPLFFYILRNRRWRPRPDTFGAGG